MSSSKKMKVFFGDGVLYDTGAVGTLFYPGVVLGSLTNFHSDLMEELREEANGSVAASDEISIIGHMVNGAGFSFKPTYDYLPYLLDMLDEATPSGSGPYVYEYVEPTTGTVSPRYQSITVTPDGTLLGTRLISAFIKTLSLSWTDQSSVDGAVTFGGYGIDSVAIPAVAAVESNRIHGKQCKVYVDEIGESIGTTPVSCVFSGSINIDTQAVQCPADDGYKGEMQSPKGYMTNISLTVGLSATTAAYLSTTANIQKLLRIEFDEGGTGANECSLVIDTQAWIKVADSNPYTDQDGIATVDLSIDVVGGSLEITHTNGTASLYA
jgi:hypothetical protein